MADEKDFAGRGRDHAIYNDDPPHAHQRSDRRSWSDVLTHRWPAVLGVAVAALTAFDLEVDAGFVSSLSALVVLMALVYLGAAVLYRRQAAWVVFLAGFAVLVVLRLLDSGVEPSLVLFVAAPVFLVLGVARGQGQRPGGLPLQTAGVLAFGAIALAALYVDPDLGGKLVAIALLGHAGWDAVHFLQNRVVPRSYSEFCAVVDLLLGAVILFVT